MSDLLLDVEESCNSFLSNGLDENYIRKSNKNFLVALLACFISASAACLATVACLQDKSKSQDCRIYTELK